MARNYSSWRLTSLMLGALVANAWITQVTLAQYTFIQDTDNNAAWDDVANWLDGGSNTTYPNAPDATALINAPTWTGAALYTLAMPATDVTLGALTIDNTNHANNFRSNFTNNGGKLIFQSTSGPATYTETAGSAEGAVNSQYQIFPIIDVLSDLVITQDNYPNLNTGTIFTNLLNGGSNIAITKEGYGAIQFNLNIALFEDEGFLGQYIINRGGIRLIGESAIANSSGVTVNSGGQLQLADNNPQVVPVYKLAGDSVLNLNGAGKVEDPSEITTGTAQGALRVDIRPTRTTTFVNPVVLQSDSVISVVNADTTFILDDEVSGAGGLTKHGSGTLTLSNANNSYSGDTTLLAGGPLSITNPFLADDADVYLVTGSILNLNFSGTDAIRSLFVDGVAQQVGTYDAANLPSLITGAGVLDVTALGVTGVPGDYNGDGTVNAADYTVWRDGGALLNEVATIGSVTPEDYDAWAARFGNSGSGSASSAAVPEPTALLLALFALCGLLTVTIRR
ncbi:MAG: autotransporter-associated beta strand repeat-containing protein [Pirellulales bacterium]